MEAQSLLKENAFFAEPETRPKEALSGFCKIAFLIKACSGQPETGPKFSECEDKKNNPKT